MQATQKQLDYLADLCQQADIRWPGNIPAPVVAALNAEIVRRIQAESSLTAERASQLIEAMTDAKSGAKKILLAVGMTENDLRTIGKAAMGM